MGRELKGVGKEAPIKSKVRQYWLEAYVSLEVSRGGLLVCTREAYQNDGSDYQIDI